MEQAIEHDQPAVRVWEGQLQQPLTHTWPIHLQMHKREKQAELEFAFYPRIQSGDAPILTVNISLHLYHTEKQAELKFMVSCRIQSGN